MIMELFVKDFTGTTQPRILKFGYDTVYCVLENQPPLAYHSLYLSTLKTSVTDFSAPIRAVVFIVCIHLKDYQLCCV